ncbi:MAG: hypothetical protein ABIO44_07730, partial [Saprospiraceae bacterium]
MARQKGLLKIKGTLDDLTFYKTQDGNLVKMKGGVSKERIATDPNFRRTRENGTEFGLAASAGKLVRDALRNLLLNAADGRIASRLTQVMTLIKDYDSTSTRGSRSVGIGITAPQGKALLKGFNFNIRAIMGGILFKPYVLNTTTGSVGISQLIPANDIAFPQGATHASLRGAWAKVDFDTKQFEAVTSNVFNVPLNNAPVNVGLTIAAPPTLATGANIFVLLIEFFQEVNGVQYSLR